MLIFAVDLGFSFLSNCFACITRNGCVKLETDTLNTLFVKYLAFVNIHLLIVSCARPVVHRCDLGKTNKSVRAKL